MSSRQRERRRCLEVLGVQEDATDDDIRKAYRRMALIFHPDKNESEDAKEKFQEISYAYKYLTEGPSAVGFEEDGHFSGHAGGHDIPIEVLIRLFPWMTSDFGVSRPSPFGGLFGHHFSSPFHRSPFDHFFMDPFSRMHGFDDDDDDDDGEVIFFQNGRVTVIKTGNSRGNYGRRRDRHRMRRQSNDSFQFRQSPFNIGHGHHSFSHSHHPTRENVNAQKRQSSGNYDCKASPPSHDHSSTAKPENSKSSERHTTNNSSYSSSTVNNDHLTDNIQGTKAASLDEPTKTETIPKGENKSKAKNSTQKVITSRKEKKKMKKANKAAKSTAFKEKTTPVNQEETIEPVIIISDDETSNIDGIGDVESTQIPLTLNKKQRRKLKRERERLEKEMAENNCHGNRVSPDLFFPERNDSTVTQEVRDDDEQSTNSSATNDTDFSSLESKSRRSRKNEKRKQKPDWHPLPNSGSPQYEDLLPRSKEDEEEMLRIAMEMSKMEMKKNTYGKSVETGTQSKKSSEDETNKPKNEKHTSDQDYHTGNNWYDDIGTSPFAKSPMQDMKKTYYKDTSSNFDPGSYYRSSQSTGLRSNGSNQSNNNASHGQYNNKNLGQKPKGYDPKYFNSTYNKPDDIDGETKNPSLVERHHQKHFKGAPQKHSVKHSIDLDELDDVPLNVNDNNSRGTLNGSFHVGEVLNSSLNVPKGIHVKQANYIYSKK